MLDVPLIRDQSTNHGTLGILYALGRKFYTMEPPDRNNKPNLSSIPPGEYILTIRSPSESHSLSVLILASISWGTIIVELSLVICVIILVAVRPKKNKINQ